jgi:hypothetical protein
MQTNTPYDDGTSNRGDLCFKSGKDACMSSNLKALHIYFWFVTGKSSMKSSKIVDKERIIELMIAKNHIFYPGTWRRSTLSSVKFFRSTLQSRNTKFSSHSHVIPSRLRQVSPIFFTLVTFHIFHLGRSPITMRQSSTWAGHPLQWDHTSHFSPAG